MGIRPEDYIEGEEPIEVVPPQHSQQEVDPPQPLQEVQVNISQIATLLNFLNSQLFHTLRGSSPCVGWH
jgi:hypothetical protein